MRGREFVDWILTSVKRSSLLRLAVAALLLLPAVWVSHGAAPISPQAKEIHNRALVFDAHIHSVEREFYHGGSIGDRQSNGQFDLPRAREGGLGAMFFSVYVAEDYYPARLETKQALRLIDCALTQLHNNHQQIELALNASDVERIHRSGKIAAVLDLDLALLQELAPEPVKYIPVRRFPTSAFDLSILAGARELAGDLQLQIRHAAGELAESVEYLREYEGSPLPDGKKSVSFRITCGDPGRTLTEQEIGAVRTSIIKHFSERGYELRV